MNINLHFTGKSPNQIAYNNKNELDASSMLEPGERELNGVPNDVYFPVIGKTKQETPCSKRHWHQAGHSDRKQRVSRQQFQGFGALG